MTDLRDTLQSAAAGSFTIERELSGGGMSRVFLANDPSLRRRIVVKVLPPDRTGAFSAERFAREVSLAASLQHPHIVPVLSAGDADGIPYYTMPFVEGESLRERISRGPLSIEEATGVLRDVARALEFAHAKGVIHRDIKPENILLAGDSAAVTDFGIAKAINDARTTTDRPDTGTLTEVGTSLGTPAYMAPEQAAGDPNVDRRADIYSFGCVAYEMLTGESPFGARPPHKLVMAHMSEAAPSVSAKRPDVPAGLASLIARCLEKSPDARPQSAKELLQAINSISTPASQVAVRRPRAVLGAIAAVVVVGAIGAYAFSRRGQAAAAPPTLAVIPVDQLNADTSERYLSDGVTDEVTTALARVPSLRVIARSSAYSYRGPSIDAKKASAKLGVRQILELAVQRRGDKLHVNADLVDGSDGTARWSQTSDYQLSNLGSIRDSIARSVIQALHVATTPAARRHEPPSEAAEMYLRGTYALDIGNESDIKRAIGYFARAHEIDPLYAQAYASEATAWGELADAYMPPVECYPRSDTLARKALALDSTIAEAYADVGWVDLLFTRNWTLAESDFKRAIDLGPNDATARFSYGLALVMSGRFAAGNRELDESTRLDPGNPWFFLSRVFGAGLLGQPDSAIAAQRKLDSIAPGYVYGESFIADVWRSKGDYQTALKYDSVAAKVMDRPTSGLVVSLVKAGRRDEAERAFHDIESVREHRYVAAEVPARAALALGHRDRALYWFRRGIEDHSLWALMMPWLPDVRPFAASDTAYQNVIRATGLSPSLFTQKQP